MIGCGGLQVAAQQTREHAVSFGNKAAKLEKKEVAAQTAAQVPMCSVIIGCWKPICQIESRQESEYHLPNSLNTKPDSDISKRELSLMRKIDRLVWYQDLKNELKTFERRKILEISSAFQVFVLNVLLLVITRFQIPYITVCTPLHPFAS